MDLPYAIREINEITVDGKKPFDSKGDFAKVKDRIYEKLDELYESVTNGQNSVYSQEGKMCKEKAIALEKDESSEVDLTSNDSYEDQSAKYYPTDNVLSN